MAVLSATLVACGDSPESPSRGARSTPAPMHAVPTLALISGADGKDVAIAKANDWKQLVVVTGDSVKGSIRPVLFSSLAWSPDGRQLAFTGDLGAHPTQQASDIYTVAVRNRRVRRVTQTQDAFNPVWSPDGRSIAFTRLRKDGITGSLWMVRPDGSGRTRLTAPGRDQMDVAGSFSPDGSLLAFTRSGEDAFPGPEPSPATIWTMRTDGSEAQDLADHASDPAFSPDGGRIAFVSDRDENGKLEYGDRVTFANELYVMDADGSKPRRLTRTQDLNEASPSWLPEGTRIAYRRGEAVDNAEGIVAMEVNADGTCPHVILADKKLHVWYVNPTWQPGRSRRGAARRRC